MSIEKSSDRSKRLLALSSAALALPGMGPQVAQAAQPTETTASYRFTMYRESSLSASEVANEPGNTTGIPQVGATSRYDIDVHQLGLSGPIGSQFGYSVAIQSETLSGASPWYTERALDGTVDVVMSGASIKDKRQDINAALTYFYDGGSYSGHFAYSTEDDYESTSFGASMEREFDNKQTAVSAGFSVSEDFVDPENDASRVNAVFPVAPPDPSSGRGNEVGKKDSYSLFVSAARVISPISQVLSGISYTNKSGYLTDPYKRFDRRPDDKEQFTWNVSYRHYLKKNKTAMHADYRFYSDSWGVNSHTITTSMYRTFHKLQIVPTLRYYLQSEADFYQPHVEREVPGDFFSGRQTYNFYSDDARLSDYGAISFGTKFILKLKPWDLSFNAEYYKAAQDIAPSKSSNLENPGLVTFYRLTFGIDRKF